MGGVHAGYAGEGPGRGGGWEPHLSVKEHGSYPGGRGLDTGGNVSQQDRQATRQAGDEAGGQQGRRGNEESCGEQEMMRAVESSRGEGEKRQAGEELCGKEATTRAVERRRIGESYGDKESSSAVARRRGERLW